DSYVVTQTDDAHSGKSAVRIQTLDSKGGSMIGIAIPKVTTGTLFQGKFSVTDYKNTLKSTKFGNPYTKKPITLKGVYKYTPGDVFYRCESVATCDKAVEDPNSVDKCSINAVLYEVTDYEDESQYLTGMDVKTSDKIVASAQLQDGSAKADWTPFELPFTYKKEYDPAKKYRFAIICSSSSDGDNFNGAPGSTLIVDDFEVVAE
ncbi:PCMD domain-containing protein, partial [uncultured Parabacteroides sp.]|uniref:PCMD domain-containing protein n=1 Tax=uncultured Parabacteroides sp. TaxID=512312 RepID=UPI00259ACC87